MITATKLHNYSVSCKESAKQMVKKSLMFPLIVCLDVGGHNRAGEQPGPVPYEGTEPVCHCWVVNRKTLLHIDLKTLLASLHDYDAVRFSCE